jgi:hypothetical protein
MGLGGLKEQKAFEKCIWEKVKRGGGECLYLACWGGGVVEYVNPPKVDSGLSVQRQDTFRSTRHKLAHIPIIILVCSFSCSLSCSCSLAIARPRTRANNQARSTPSHPISS